MQVPKKQILSVSDQWKNVNRALDYLMRPVEANSRDEETWGGSPEPPEGDPHWLIVVVVIVVSVVWSYFAVPITPLNMRPIWDQQLS